MLTRRLPTTWIASQIACAALLAASGAHADGSATAEQLFRQGREAVAKRDFAVACRLFEASYKLEEGLGTLLNMAKCHEDEGKIGTAWGDYNSLEQKATRAGPSQKERAVFARARVLALEPRLTRLRIQVPQDPPQDYEVLVAGNSIPAVLRSAGVIVDVGHVEIVATAPGFIPWKNNVPVAGEGVVLDLAIPKLEPEPPKPKTDTGAVRPDDAPAGHKTLGYVAVGTGAAFLAGGLVFGGLALSKADSAKGCGEPCNGTAPDGQTNPALVEARDAYDQGKTFALLSNILVVAGLATGAVGAYFVLSAPKPEAAKTSRVRVLPYGTLGSRMEITF